MRSVRHLLPYVSEWFRHLTALDSEKAGAQLTPSQTGTYINAYVTGTWD